MNSRALPARKGRNVLKTTFRAQILQFLQLSDLVRITRVSSDVKRFIESHFASTHVELNGSLLVCLKGVPWWLKWSRRSAAIVQSLRLANGGCHSAALWSYFQTMCDWGMPLLHTCILRLPLGGHTNLDNSFPVGISLPALRHFDLSQSDVPGQLILDAPSLATLAIAARCIRKVQHSISTTLFTDHPPPYHPEAQLIISNDLRTTKWLQVISPNDLLGRHDDCHAGWITLTPPEAIYTWPSSPETNTALHTYLMQSWETNKSALAPSVASLLFAAAHPINIEHSEPTPVIGWTQLERDPSINLSSAPPWLTALPLLSSAASSLRGRENGDMEIWPHMCTIDFTHPACVQTVHCTVGFPYSDSAEPPQLQRMSGLRRIELPYRLWSSLRDRYPGCDRIKWPLGCEVVMTLTHLEVPSSWDMLTKWPDLIRFFGIQELLLISGVMTAKHVLWTYLLAYTLWTQEHFKLRVTSSAIGVFLPPWPGALYELSGGEYNEETWRSILRHIGFVGGLACDKLLNVRLFGNLVQAIDTDPSTLDALSSSQLVSLQSWYKKMVNSGANNVTGEATRWYTPSYSPILIGRLPINSSWLLRRLETGQFDQLRFWGIPLVLPRVGPE